MLSALSYNFQSKTLVNFDKIVKKRVKLWDHEMIKYDKAMHSYVKLKIKSIISQATLDLSSNPSGLVGVGVVVGVAVDTVVSELDRRPCVYGRVHFRMPG